MTAAERRILIASPANPVILSVRTRHSKFTR